MPPDPKSLVSKDKYLPAILALEVAVLTILFVILRNKTGKKTEDVHESIKTSPETKNESAQQIKEAIVTKAKQTKNARRFFFSQALSGAVFISLGLIAIWSTQTPIDTSQVQTSIFEVTPRFDSSYTAEEIEAGNDFDVLITIEILPNNKDCLVTLSISPHKIASVSGDLLSPNHTVTFLTSPQFNFVWPGNIELAGFTKDAMSDYFELSHNKDTTTIISKRRDYPWVEFTWYGAVKQAGLFKKRVALNFAEQTYINVKAESGENSYKVVILPVIPSDSTITFISPKLELLADGLLVVEKENGQFDYSYTVTNGYFEVEYENSSAAKVRELLIIISGIAFGIAGNFLANIITKLFNRQVE